MKKQPTFMEGVVFALLISVSASAVFYTLSTLFPGDVIFRFLISTMSLAYIIYLLLRSRERTGRIVVISLWGAMSVAGIILIDSILFFVLSHLLMIWLVRSLYYYNSILSSLMDLGLNALAMSISIWAWLSTGSLFMAFWCLFLVQALFIVIPRHIKRADKQHQSSQSERDHFEHAHSAAEVALRKLSSNSH